MPKVRLEWLVAIGMGVKTTTYFKLMYTLRTGCDEYFINHVAIFGTN